MQKLNALILAGGRVTTNSQGQSEQYPDYLTEHNGTPLIEHLIKQCDELEPHKIICLLPGCEAARYHLRNMVAQISPAGDILAIPGPTAGAACTALLACEAIDNDNPLLILGSNEFLSIPLRPALQLFQQSDADAGVFTFKSLHPRYAFVRLDDNARVIEASEKNPISAHAITGSFWFRRGADFVAAAKNMIRKDIKTGDAFYISSALNELILNDQCIATYAISPTQYHSLRSVAQLYAFETGVTP